MNFNEKTDVMRVVVNLLNTALSIPFGMWDRGIIQALVDEKCTDHEAAREVHKMLDKFSGDIADCLDLLIKGDSHEKM